MSLTVKAYLEKPGVTKPEIRRFAVDQDVSTNFLYVSQKLNTIFPGLGNKGYQVFWKDEEDDLICISSDEELVQALGTLEGDIFKIYIKEFGSSDGDNQGVLHPNVICDGCEGPVYGSRYKCISCPNYDLCSSCNNRGLHQEHNMICLRQPGSPFMAFMGPHGPHGHGPSSHGHWRQFRRHWRQWWQQMMGQQEGQQGGRPAGEPQGGEATNRPCEEQPGPQESQNSSNPGDEYLRTIGEQVAAMLDPMGIDVAVDIEHNGHRTRCGNSPSPGPNAACQSQKPKEQDPKVKQEEQIPGREKVTPREDMETGEPESGAEASRISKEGSPATSARSDASDNEWVTVQTEVDSDDTKPKEEHKFEFLPAPTAPAEFEGAAASRTPLYPVVPSVHPDPHIQEALEQMKSMGFNNDDGRLVRLLEAKNGNISQVLDSLKSQ